MSECRHLSIHTSRNEEHDITLWACDDCQRRFYPACEQCVSIGHRGGHAEHPAAIESEAQRLTVERLQEAETLLADAQPNGLEMSPVEWQKRRHNLLAALAREETGE